MLHADYYSTYLQILKNGESKKKLLHGLLHKINFSDTSRTIKKILKYDILLAFVYNRMI